MKILLVSTEASGGRRVSGGCDSAVLRPGEPVFTEQAAADWLLMVAPAVRISRLGYHIPLRHAGRHYDALAAVALQKPRFDDGVPPLFHDRAISPGAWLSPEDFGSAEFELAVQRKPLPGRCSDVLDARARISITGLGVDETVAWLSGKMTLKTGDIIIFGDAALELGTPIPDTALTATLGGLESLSIRIK